MNTYMYRDGGHNNDWNIKNIYDVAYLNIVRVFGTIYFEIYRQCMDLERMMFINAEQAKCVRLVPWWWLQ